MPYNFAADSFHMHKKTL